MSCRTDHCVHSVLFAALVALIAGCNASPLAVLASDGGPDLPDFSVPVVSRDMAISSRIDLNVSDLALPSPMGWGKMVAGSYFLYGITSDNLAIALDLAKNTSLVAVPVGANSAA